MEWWLLFLILMVVAGIWQHMIDRDERQHWLDDTRRRWEREDQEREDEWRREAEQKRTKERDAEAQKREDEWMREQEQRRENADLEDKWMRELGQKRDRKISH